MAINPLQYFNVGSQIGQMNSPASGPGQMIRNLLQQAQKKGLLQEQSQAQLSQGTQLAEFKAGLEPTEKHVRILDRSGELGDPIPIGINTEIKSQPAAGMGDFFDFQGDGLKTRFDPEDVKIRRILEGLGAPATPANVRAYREKYGG